MYLTYLFKTTAVLKKTQTLELQNTQTNEKCIAKWKDMTKIYKEKMDSIILKETKMDYMTLYLTNFEKQKVNLVVNT